MTESPQPYGPPGGTPAGYGSGYPQAGQGAAGHGQPGGKRNGLGIAALVVGILAVVTSLTVVGGIVLGIVAIVLGVLGRKRAGRGEADNGGVALAGTVLGAVGLVASIALIALGLSILNSDSGQKLQDCLDNAGQDQAAVQQCQQEFQNDLGQ